MSANDLADRLDLIGAETEFRGVTIYKEDGVRLRAAAARLRQLTDRRTQLTGDTSVDIAITYGYEVGVEDGRAEGVDERDEYRRQLDTLRNAIGKLIPWAESYRMHHVVIALRELLALAAVGDPEEGRDEQ